MMNAINDSTKLAEMDALIKDFRAALAAPRITEHGLTNGIRTSLDVVVIGNTWRVVMRGVEEAAIDVPAPTSSDGSVPNPFCNKNVAERMEFWFKSTACWCELFIGGRIRRCNATSEIVNNILKNNSMDEKSDRMVARCKLTPG
jgi:hypothetical protein